MITVMELKLLDIARGLVGIVYPERCAACGGDTAPGSVSGVCRICLGRIRGNPEPYCQVCGKTMPEPREMCRQCGQRRPLFKKALSACVYEGELKELIHAFKFGNKSRLGHALASVMHGFIKDKPDILAGVDTIAFVPLHAGRERERGFNQSRVLADRLSWMVGIEVCDMLVKTRATRHQNELSREDRLKNLSGSFSAKRNAIHKISGAVVLLIDDVMTTGATLDECASALAAAGAKEVRCLTLARGV